jgi:adenine-specific DNA methylase
VTGELFWQESAKALGAFYTDAQVAEFLVWWGVRSAEDSVLDPSFGGGVFLRAACKRLSLLGGEAGANVRGIEINGAIHGRISKKLFEEFGVSDRNLVHEDFFKVKPEALVDAVVGNPPFIRYQRFTGEQRERALRCAAEAGVRLTKLSSSWAPFVVQSMAHLKVGGRLAMVLPAELGHAAYAKPVLDFLARRFESVRILSFKVPLFPDLNESTVLVLGENHLGKPKGIFLSDLGHAGELLRMRMDQFVPAITRYEPEDHDKVIHYFLPKVTRELYESLKRSEGVETLGDAANVGIGYVTGANEFFHLVPEQAAQAEIPTSFLRKAVNRGRALSGLIFGESEWRRCLKYGEASYLLSIPADATLPESLQRYLKAGIERGVADAYKCKARTPWYSVPHVYEPDAFLSYMAGAKSRLVANRVKAVAPNSLLMVRIHKHRRDHTGESLACLWQTALTALSVEIEGHSLGGGMLKLEPKEATRVLIPKGDEAAENFADEFSALSEVREEDGNNFADESFLQKIGVTKRECKLLREGATILKNRRKI